MGVVSTLSGDACGPGDPLFRGSAPHFSGTIEDRTDASFLEPTLSLQGPLPLTTSVQAHYWPVDCSSSVDSGHDL